MEWAEEYQKMCVDFVKAFMAPALTALFNDFPDENSCHHYFDLCRRSAQPWWRHF